MFSIKNIATIFFLLVFTFGFSQEKKEMKEKAKKSIKTTQLKYNPLKPSKAAFYSAIIPSAGQIYNKKFFWVPFIWGGLGASVYFYLDNNKSYNRYRTAFRLRSAGLPDEFTDANGNVLLSNESLENGQRQFRENRDFSILSFVIIYVLQIVEASITAHLIQFDASDNLSVSPTPIIDPTFNDAPKVGFTLKYSF